MKARKIMTALLMIAVSFTMCMFMGVAGAHAAESFNIDVSPFAVGAGLFTAYTVLQFGMSPSGGFAFAIQQELWVNYILGNLFKDDSFANHCFNEDQYVLNGSVCHIPTAGAKPEVVKNRSSLPATAVQRTDTDITYPLDVFTSTPTLITDAEKLEISYDKMDSVLSEHMDSLSESVHDEIIYKWAPTAAAQILRTTGADVATSLSPSATGTRKKLVKEDLKKAQALMNKNKIAKADRFALIPSDLYQELTEDATLMARDGVNGGEINVKDGVILRLYGFQIMERSDTPVYTNATPPVPKAPGAAAAATDNQAVICWQKNSVGKCKGTIKPFENTDDPQYYGSIYSMLVKAGARIRRTAGVVAIVQAAGA